VARSFGSIASSLYSSTSTLSRQSLLPQTHIEPSSPSNAGIKNKKNYRVRHNYQIVPALSGNIYSMFFFNSSRNHQNNSHRNQHICQARTCPFDHRESRGQLSV
jgi:hypothetical protein